MDDSRPGTDPMDEGLSSVKEAGGPSSVLAKEIERLAHVIDSLHQRIAALERSTGTGLTTF
jgi:hypothetical protein